jgi:hypothetical protein
MLGGRQKSRNPGPSSHAHLLVVVVTLEAEEVLALDEALPATVVALDVAAAEEVLTEVVIEALRVLETDGPDADEVDEPAVDVLCDADVDEPDAPAVAEPDDPDVEEPGDPVLAVFQ